MMILLQYVLDKPEINLRHGSSLVTNLNLLVIENDRLTLDCQIQSNPSTIEPITWLKNGASMTGMYATFHFYISSNDHINAFRYQFTYINIANN